MTYRSPLSFELTVFSDHSLTDDKDGHAARTLPHPQVGRGQAQNSSVGL